MRRMLDMPKKSGQIPFTVEALKAIVSNHQNERFYWPNEDKDAEDFEPLIIDMQTANVCVKVLEVVKPETKETIEKMISEKRSQFINFVKKAWGCVS